MAQLSTNYAVDAGIATITLTREDNKNALSVELLNSLGDNLQAAFADSTVRAVVLTNEGNTFCAGADLKGDRSQSPRYPLDALLDLIQSGSKPVLARIAGHCMGGGVGLAAACDLSIAADDCKFGFTEVRIGVAPAIISVVCLPKMRYGDAMELFLSGERISATRATELGLLNKAVPADQLDAAVRELLDKLLLGGPKALAVAKQLVNKVSGMDRSEAFKWTAQLSAELFASEEASVGIQAFRERRTPPWVPEQE